METVKAQIEEMLYNNEDDFKIAKVLKNDLKDYLSNLEVLFKTTGGKDFLVRHTQKIDNLMKLVYKIALREMFGDYAPMKNNLPISMVALGSYGREQLCVHSDIDLMIVFEEIPGYNHTAFIEKILYILWDTGLKLGHRVHNIDELFSVSETDITIKTALIESRFIEGSSFVWTKTQNAIRQIRHHDTETFIADKLTEQQDKHHTYPLTMEPHLKEGVGGFRDANLVYWIGKVLYNADNIKNIPEKFISDKEYREFRIALEFLFRTRSALHLVAGKKEDRLRLDLIPGVSELLGYEQTGAGQMRFSKKVSESLKTIRLYSTIWIEMLTRQFLPPVMDSVFIMPEKADEKFLDLLQQLVSAADHPFSVHPTMLRLLTHASKPERINQTYYPTIFELFYKPHLFYVLRTLSHAKLLGYTLQPLQKVIDLPQFDGYHNFAVDIHSLECVRYLENIQDPFLAELHNTLNEDEKALLKMVVLLHDAGKGRKRDHHNVGVSLFKVFAQKLGMKPELIEMGETLILYHTTMSRVAQREDLHNNNTILKFASYFKTKKMLDLLYILTYADMSGVATDVYNTFSAKLLHTLYRRALEVLDQEELLDEAAQRVKKEEMVKRHPEFETLKKSEKNKVLKITSNLFFLKTSAEQIITLSKEALKVEDYSFKLNNNKHLSIRIFRKKPIHIGYLLSKLAQLEVRQMDIYKLFDEVKYFHIDFAEKVMEEDLERIESYIHTAFTDIVYDAKKVPLIKPGEIKIDCDHSRENGVLYLNCANQNGLLAYVTSTFENQQMEIVSAKIHTIKNRARDMFLIEKNGNFCHNVDTITDLLTSQEG